jgi:hypothetical protein
MEEHKYNGFIDDYLLNKLNKEESDHFEEHYFNCQSCFEKLEEREELIAVIKARGKDIFQEELKPTGIKAGFSIKQLLPTLTPTNWILATVSAALIFFIILSISPLFKKTQPQFFLDEEGVLRGTPITIISPVTDIKAVPSRFEWKRLGDEVEYKVSLYLNQEVIWNTATKENYVSLPEEIQNLMKEAQKYSWEVKAFSPQGALIAVSSKVEFKISSTQ